MKKQKLIFHVIGYSDVGLGHIYRSLALAKELDEFQISFVCDQQSKEMTKLLVSGEYELHVIQSESTFDEIIGLNPDLLINDILSTNEKDIIKIRNNNIKVVNFEDLGSGSKIADLTINELYDKPKFEAPNIFWGHEYFFLRDEFLQREPNPFQQEIRNILITYGGTDSNNLTKQTFDHISDLCILNDIFIYIVSGPGYQYYDELQAALYDIDNVHLTHSTGVISDIMQKVQIAFTSNGRTVYDLARMNIPSIVISQHEREAEHAFSSKENGMIHMGQYEDTLTKGKILNEFKKMIENKDYFKSLHDKTSKLDFSENKKKVVEIIRSIAKG